MYTPSKKETVDMLMLIRSDYEKILGTLSYNDEKRSTIYKKISAIDNSITLVEKTKSKIFVENNTNTSYFDGYIITPDSIEMGML